MYLGSVGDNRHVPRGMLVNIWGEAERVGEVRRGGERGRERKGRGVGREEEGGVNGREGGRRVIESGGKEKTKKNGY